MRDLGPEESGPEGASEQILLMRTGRSDLGLPLLAVREVTPLPLLTRPPGAPRLLAGFFRLRGESVAVVDLGRLLETGAEAPGLHAAVVVLDREPLIGLLVDRVAEVVDAPPGALRPAPAGTSPQDCCPRNLALDDSLVAVLEPTLLLLEEEERRLEELAQQLRSRREQAETTGR